jgi:hypothetical protein
LIRGLLILNASYSGARDLWWPPDPVATKGYVVYRAYDAPVNWTPVNAEPIPGTFFRDVTRTETVVQTITADAWLDNGTMGMRVFKLHDVPYARIENGVARVAYSPSDLIVHYTYADGTKGTTIPGQVVGHEQTVYLRIDRDVAAGGAVSATPLIDFSRAPVFTVEYQRLVNHVDIFTNMLRTYYVVVPVTDHGEQHAPGAPGSEIVDSSSVDRMDYMQAEMVRRDAWLFEQVAEPAYLMLRRQAGEICGCTDNPSQIARTGCRTCYETGIVGGYYGPFDFPFVDPNQGLTRTVDEGGVQVERSSRSYLGPTPVIQDGDLIIRRTGERLVIANANHTRPRGILLQQDFDVNLLKPGDTRYRIPILDPSIPLIYNPAVSDDPKNGEGGGEPVYTANTVPHKHWENPDVQAGQTIRFGRIQS